MQTTMQKHENDVTNRLHESLQDADRKLIRKVMTDYLIDEDIKATEVTVNPLLLDDILPRLKAESPAWYGLESATELEGSMFQTSLKGHFKNIFRKKGEEFEAAIKKEIVLREKGGVIDSKTSSAKTHKDSTSHLGKRDKAEPDEETQNITKFTTAGGPPKQKQEVGQNQDTQSFTFSATTRRYNFDEFQIIQRELEMFDLRRAIATNRRELKANRKKMDMLNAQARAQYEEMTDSEIE